MLAYQPSSSVSLHITIHIMRAVTADVNRVDTAGLVTILSFLFAVLWKSCVKKQQQGNSSNDECTRNFFKL